jgi:hypothetical protein
VPHGGAARRPVLRDALEGVPPASAAAPMSSLLHHGPRCAQLRAQAGGVGVTALDFAGIAASVVAAVIVAVEREMVRIELETLRMLRNEPSPLPTARVVRGR